MARFAHYKISFVRQFVMVWVVLLFPFVVSSAQAQGMDFLSSGISAQSHACTVSAGRLSTAREVFMQRCGGRPVDCDPVDGQWMCSNQQIGQAAPKQAVQPATKPEVCAVRGDTLAEARQAYARLCSQPRRDCDPFNGQWYCANVMIGDRSPTSPTSALSRDALERHVQRLIQTASGGRGLSAFMLPNDGDYVAIPQDPSNPITIEKVLLGRFLFHDTAFGLNGRYGPQQQWSCATCHHAAAGFKSGSRQGIGNGGRGFGANGAERYLSDDFDPHAESHSDMLPDLQPLASPSVLHSAWQDVMLWNGQFGNRPGGVVNAGIDAQRLMTSGTPKAVNATGLSGVEVQAIAGSSVHRLRFEGETPLTENPIYRALWQSVYGSSDISQTEGAGKAIAAFERTIIANQAPFQRWLRGEQQAMNDEQLKGAALFFGKAGCADCHRGPGLSSEEGALPESIFFAVGFGDMDHDRKQMHGAVNEADRLGRGGFTGQPSDNYAFKIPQLYNLSDAGFLGHGATFDSVRAVIEYKNAAVPQNPAAIGHLDQRFRPLGLSESEVTELTAFVAEALNDPNLMRYQPRGVPSGRCVVVNPEDDYTNQFCASR